MALEQAIITWIHLVSASIWVGGGLFLGIVLAPILKKTSLSLEERIGLMIKIGRRFNKIAVPSLAILIGTGIYSSYSLLGNPDLLFRTSYGEFLVVKMILVVAVIVTFAVHVRIIRRDVEEKITAGKMSEPEIQRLRKKIIILGEIMSVISVIILLLAALLDAGV